MATLKQIEANRRNALKSTGPRTAEGKAIVSMNALRHGLFAHTTVLPGENREEFNRLYHDLQAEWEHYTGAEQRHLEQMAVSQWKLTRMEVAEVYILGKMAATADRVPLLDRFSQNQCRLQRSYAKAQRGLHRLQISRHPPYNGRIPNSAPS